MHAVGAGGSDIFTLIYPFSPLSPSLWETARYRLKYCLKGPLNPKQPTNQLFTTLEKQLTSSIQLVEYLSVNRKRENMEVHLNEFGYCSRCEEISPWGEVSPRR